MKTLEEIRKEYYEKRMNKLAFMGDAGSEFKDNLWSWITDNFVPKSTISQTKQELIEEAKQKILEIPDETMCPDKYYRKYTNNWRSQHTRNPSGRAWIMWFLENYLTNE